MVENVIAAPEAESKCEREFYVYALFRPWNGVVCYIGKGKGDRWNAHERFGDSHSNKHLANILKKARGSLPKVKVREGLTEAEAFEIEIALIRAIGRGKNGPLVNLTDGGDGLSGLKHSPETILLMKKNMKGVKRKKPASNKGRPLSETVKAKISATLTGRKTGPRSAEYSENLSKALKGVARPYMVELNKSPERRAKVSAGLKGKPKPHMAEANRRRCKGKNLSEAHKESISIGVNEFYSSERGVEANLKKRDALTGRTYSKDHRSNISKGLKGKPKSKEHRANLSAARLLLFEKRRLLKAEQERSLSEHGE